jgi:hypothetical protein
MLAALAPSAVKKVRSRTKERELRCERRRRDLFVFIGILLRRLNRGNLYRVPARISAREAPTGHIPRLRKTAALTSKI